MTWRPELKGWSDDILPFYARMATDLRNGAEVVEVGVAWFRSALFLAEQLLELGKRATIWCVDSWAENYGTSEGWRQGSGWFREAMASLVANGRDAEVDMLRVLRLDSESASELFLPLSVDMVFIDGDHSYEAVADDIAAWGPLVTQSGSLCGHDYTNYPGVKRAVDERVAAMGGKLHVQQSVWEIRR